MDDTEAELRGRIAMVETMLGVTLTHVAALTDRPDVIIRDVMANTEAMLDQALKAAPPEEKRAAEYAQAAFEAIGTAMLAHLTKHAPAQGKA